MIAIQKITNNLHNIAKILPLTIIFLSIPTALASEKPIQIDKEQASPTIQVANTSSLPQNNAPIHEEKMVAQDSIVFLMGPLSPVQQSSPSEPAVPTEKAASSLTAIAPDPVIMPSPDPLLLPPFEKTEDVSMLVAEKCSQSGSDAEGTTSCRRTYSDGHYVTVVSERLNEGDEFKRQLVIEEYDKADKLLDKKTVRRRIDYNYLDQKKIKERELFDIIRQPTDKKTTRELMVYEYSPHTGKASSITWTQYKQISDQPKANLNFYALLRYGEDGKPEQGIAEKWDNGQKVVSYMNWNRFSDGYTGWDENTWQEWETWIRNASLQAYLP